MTLSVAIKEILEKAVNSNFRMRPLFEGLAAELPRTVAHEPYLLLTQTAGTTIANYVMQSLVRAAFLIELVKTPKIDSTKFDVRWTDRLAANDPRRASYEECFAILLGLLGQLESALSNPANGQLLGALAAKRQVAYELPVDYRKRNITTPIHRADNMAWMWDDLPQRVVSLRTLLLSPKTNPYVAFFHLAYDKVRVKTYLTDRVLTGVYKTNREKRWETHPASVHFALRRSCLEIEYMLINQLCHFEGCPPELVQLLETAGLLSPLDVPFRCPITMEPLSFEEFEREARDPTHGKASFQVGHLNPLKALNADPRSGHTAQNISWISADGNRIQGSLSLAETRMLIRRIADNYERFRVPVGAENSVWS
ncbi:MAG TPA: hypothetical protein VFE37_24530 [Chloroflexota bacterium]|nr:hypothetical protein [Chloroflexota bacterium]